MASLLKLSEARLNLRIIDESSDEELALKSEMASAIVVDFIKRPNHGWTEDTAPYLVKAAIALVLQSLFDDLGTDPLTDGVKSILHRFRDPTIA